MKSVGIVLGGSGFIGFHLIRHFVTVGMHTAVVSIDVQPPRAFLPGVEYVTADLRSAIPERFGCAGATIYNLAAIRDYPGHAPAAYYDTNVVIAQRAVEFAEKTEASTIVFTSSMSVYSPGDDPRSEDSPVAPTNPYGGSKVICELINDSWFSRNAGVRLITLRPAVVFGLYDRGNFTRLARALKMGCFVYVGRKDTIKSSVYVGDLVQSIQFCLSSRERRILYNCAYPQRYTIQNIAEAMADVGRLPRPRATVPYSVAAAAAIPFEWLDSVGVKNPVRRERLRKLLDATNVVPSWLEEHGFRFPTDLRSGLELWLSECPHQVFQ